ncbi:hypothetical protein MXD59_24520 [Frankia sp. Ag45/Mut15]|uniref:Uncharacterized protein n=1 Tax=Frankia umida TaxID=573489 RepID=A0ABT0K598_9ACTN|nr:hypothetical protein [Frankia umida]MCK9878886.1 hypothetical protein [Frankia umida]
MSTTHGNAESTRLLCAAVLVDRDLPGRLVWEAAATARALPPATDVDLATATCIAVGELRKRRIRDGLLSVCLLLFIVGLTGPVVGNIALMVFAPASLAVAWLVVLTTIMIMNDEMVEQFSRDGFDPVRIAGRVDRKSYEEIRRIYDHPVHNVTVYSGYSPFVGSGNFVGSWSFAVDVHKPADRNTPPGTFAVEELRDHVLDGVRDLRWPRLTIEDRLLINGRDLTPDSPLLPDRFERPRQTVDGPTFEALLAGADENVRRYTCIRVHGWDDTLVFSLWLRFVLHPRSLYVEASSAVLTPVRKSYDLPEQLATMTGRERFRHDRRAASRHTLALLVGSVRSTIGFWRTPRRIARSNERDRRLIRLGLPFDYGSGPTVREAVADPNFQHYFQRSDKEMYVKTVESKILDLIVDFLDDRGIDTDSLVARQTTILNSGVMVTGGATMTSQNVAVGAQPSIINRISRAGSGSPPAPSGA